MPGIVCDASPLIVLAKADLLDVLPRLFNPVLVPLTVVAEILAGPDKDPMRAAMNRLSWLKVVHLDSELTPLTHWRLGKGESEVIEYARLHTGTSALLDDQAGRRAGTALGVAVLGTLGVLAMAAAGGFGLRFEDVIQRLRCAGLYLDEETIQRVKDATPS